jgi:predicted GTPase
MEPLDILYRLPVCWPICTILYTVICYVLYYHTGSWDKSISYFQEEELRGAVLVVLANKQDIEGALSVAEVHQALGLDALKNRTFQIFKTSATKGEGLDQAMDWLANALQNRKWPSDTELLICYKFNVNYLSHNI